MQISIYSWKVWLQVSYLEDWEEVAPSIFEIHNGITNCDEIIENANLRTDWEDATVYAELVRKDIRNNRSLFINPYFNNDVFWWQIAKNLWSFGNDYGLRHSLHFRNMDNPQILHYSAGEGFYSPHSDGGEHVGRLFSLVAYLNDVDDGGETYFTKFDISIKPKKGKIVLFPSNYAYEHEARMPISGDKYSIVTWFTT